MARRIVILGGPHTGKTTLSNRLQAECGFSNVRHSDDIKDLGWSESSAAASEWFNDQGEWVAEGVQMARALRKWLKANPDTPLDIDIVTLNRPFDTLLKGQESMAKGVFTVFREIESELIRRGARIHALKDPDDAVGMFSLESSGGKMPDEDEGKEKDSSKETASLNKRLKKHEGDAMALAAELSAENADLNRQLSAAKGLKPKEGSVVLTPEQAKQWEAFVALGKPEEIIASYQEYVALGKAEDLKTKIAANVELETKVAEVTEENASLKRADLLRKVAGDHKYDFEVFSVLDERAGKPEYEQREVIVEGKTSNVWHQKESGKWVPVDEFHASHNKSFIPSLKAQDAKPEGTQIPAQRADDKGKDAQPNLADQYMTNTYKGIAKAAA